MRPFRPPMVAAVAALCLSACGPQDTVENAPPSAVEDTRTPEQSEAQRTPHELNEAFARAAGEFQVPADLLKAIAYAETRFEMLSTQQEFEGMPAAHGLMALRGENLARGARLAGVTEEAARTKPEENIRAAAALLSSYAAQAGLDRSDVGAWAPVVVKLSGITHPDAQAEYVHRDVYGVMRKGMVARTPEGRVAVSLMPSEVAARFDSPRVRAMLAGPDYAAAVWRPSPNYGSRPTGAQGDVQMIVIHTCEGTYSSCWSWLTNSASGVSAHYVVREDGGEISQLVRESDRGWHVGASYDPSLNGGTMGSLSGVSVNHFSVGIEHGGSASQSSFPAGQIEASAKLSCDISKGQAVPIDSYHIVAHGKLQPASRTDPGPNWPWSTYLSKVKSYCGTPSTTAITVDSDNALNDSAKGYIELTGTWASASSTPNYFGSDYLYAATEAVSEPATFHFYLPTAGTRTISAWWTSGTNRSTATPFVVYGGATKLGSVNVNQQVGGGAWNTLGTWSFPAGWNKVQVSRWAPAGFVVVADAIRVQ
ncbi:Negative regulator of beta-lactamase expression [Cystobacter fuscus DSM 2262]|uniref:N-acetylmuramoyl-L-alanine amidase n=1 Tax=Cystobacter fuscus (strain ATCC 25194 / DSM 2262 / NBRC 100088 / M29) TaxID=1242864 RepID=S9P5G1_CYSF2|nr:N-acetylmuramoyl-L-alanine amidase [Cystobacter fuscus]EPX59665.1 Negative regulator of beta-lactamase expression [Cystobacter fuscus DSM 2262]